MLLRSEQNLKIAPLKKASLSSIILIMKGRSGKENTLITKASQKLSEVSFKKVWDNEEDAVYDRL